MSKKFLTFFLCVILGVSLVSCNSVKKQDTADENVQQGTAGDGGKEDSSKEPLLGPDATDEDLLEAIDDDINVVTEENFSKTVAEIKENTGDYSGQLFQMEGYYIEEDGNSYLTNTLTEDKKMESSLPLVYVAQKPESGAHVRVTGVVNVDDFAGSQAAVLQAVVVEPLD